MNETELKLEVMKRILDNYFMVLKNRPKMLGSIDEIESTFFWMDQFNIILTHGAKSYDDGLSWRAFLKFKGIAGPNSNATEFIMKSSDPFATLSHLRCDYNEFVNMKIVHRNNPNNGPLIELLKKSNKREACELLGWFIRYPSIEALEIYSKYIIDNNYFEEYAISIGIAAMGGEAVIDWCSTQMESSISNDLRRFALKCIAVSPLERVDKLIRRVISDKNMDDLYSVACVLCDSMNKLKFEWIEKLLAIPNKTTGLNGVIKLTLESLANKESSTALR
jgi:hypothetical protein